MPEGEVFILTNVVVIDLTNNEEIKFTLVSPEEADFELDKISATSPLGQGLLGKKVGDIVKIEVASGAIEYKIIEISK